MLKSKNKKGFTLLETIIAMEITGIMIIFIISFTIKLNKAKITLLNNYSKNSAFDALCKEIKYNWGYGDAVYLMENGLIYMQENSLETEVILNSNSVQLFSNIKDDAIVQLEFEFPEEKVAKIYVSLKDDSSADKDIIKLISLGNYEWK
ncbi:prepilin-type N-terminal cleavage/methylation domain-containing protein [Clostridium grantii]|uniref:Prepilin-type N-terminal cleavage/methylation domain-containing protein n=1 Tax=Clostridium grantii DSM 8605 TaxID=1121316 RepID=A0A1M5SG57_9CLOT|nr:prepilin-type N-terminal cleavage/methylation domain-containing protein [Clostridium grantii]SHH37524.1 hypothetical protein SAMN02745207_00922 [Clostridium grantii DSM 8605]